MSFPTAYLEELATVLPKCVNISGLPPDVLKILDDTSKSFLENIRSKTNQFLHDLDDKKHTEEEVESMIDLFPSSLAFKNKWGMLPIQAAVFYSNRKKFIPLLAQKGAAHNIGGAGSRGGLLNQVPTATDGKNVIQCLANFGASDATRRLEFDTNDRAVLQDLRSRNLLLRGDIKYMNLLAHACVPVAQRRFQYLVEWNPKALKMTMRSPKPDTRYILIHDVIEHQSTLDSFDIALKAGVKYFPTELGFLFHQLKEHNTPCEMAMKKFGMHETMAIIKKHIPSGNGHPILHSVIKSCPQFFDDFVTYYGKEMNIRDRDGRLLIHAKLAFGREMYFHERAILDSELAEKDPVTGLLPFMLTAMGETSNLTGTYELLRRKPNVIYRDQ